jgi:hypothetical protein
MENPAGVVKIWSPALRLSNAAGKSSFLYIFPFEIIGVHTNVRNTKVRYVYTTARWCVTKYGHVGLI